VTSGSPLPSRAARDLAALSVRGVSFAYSPVAEPVLHALDLNIPDGDHLAIG
jgi:ATP-binding cassette subfamily C protein